MSGRQIHIFFFFFWWIFDNTCNEYAGYVDDTFKLVWRRQDVDGNQEEEVPLYWNSTATLHEMGMPSEPMRCYLLIKEKEDGSQPKRLEEGEGGQETGQQPAGQTTKKVPWGVEKLIVITI